MWFRSRNQPTAALRAGEATRGLAALSIRPVIALPEGEEPPTEFRIFAVGVNETEKGQFLWDEVAAAMCMDFWKTKRVDLSMDWEHQALAEPPIEAPASAWWDPEIRNGELWATNVRWTTRAAEQIRNKEYRYFSPAFTFDPETRRPDRIINAALTNIPAMDALVPLVAATATAADQAKETKDMEELAALKAKLSSMETEMSALRAQLSAKDTENADLKAKLSAFSDDEKEECRVAGLRIDVSRTERRSTVAALSANAAKLRELTGEATDAAAIARVTVMKGDAAEVVQLRASIAEAEERAINAELTTVLAEGVKAKKIQPAEDHPARKRLITAALGMGGGKMTKEGIAWLKAEIADRAPLVAGRETVERPVPGVALTEQQKRIARLSGMSVTDRAKAAERDAAEANQ